MLRFSSLFLAIALSTLGCSCPGKDLVGDGGVDGDNPDVILTCGALTEACSATAPCCTGSTCDAVSSTCTTCAAVNDACSPTSPCCDGLTCDPGSSLCVAVVGECKLTTEACTDPRDCCSLSCSALGACQATCIQNTQTCVVNGDCCSGNCVSLTCVPATGAMCVSTGNACTIDDNCCSHNCQDNVCRPSGAACVSFGDVCYKDGDCCSASCTENNSGVGGICNSLGVPGTGSCHMAGEPCGVCSECCSATCIPTATGGSVCLQASGCAVEGELCSSNTDCCGAPAPDTTCTRASPGDAFGRCIQNGGTSNGNVCKSETPWCESVSQPSNCEECISPKDQCCRIDANGTPRCFGGSTQDCPAGYNSNDPNCCVAAGEVCSFSSECCGGTPCLPDPSMPTRLICGATCSPENGDCRTSGDCCLGLECNTPAGQTMGTCKQPVVPPPPPTDGGVPDSGVPDGGTPICSQFGQACGDTQPCCQGVYCLSPGTGTNCAAGEVGCTCFGIIIE